MGRSVSADLQNLLNLDVCETHSTLDIYLVDLTELHFTTKNGGFTLSGITRTDDLRGIGEIKQSIGSQTDRVTGVIQNVDKLIATKVTNESLAKASAVVGRLYQDSRGILPSVWIELFRGELIAGDLDAGGLDIEIINDLVAAGYCIADASLAENCQWVYKQADTCGYAGGLTTCNKLRRSPGGCEGHIVTGTTSNEYRYGGLEFPDRQDVAAPSGDPVRDPIDEPPKNCPRLDQWILVQGGFSKPVAIRVGMLSYGDRIFNPITRTYHVPSELAVVRSVPIWQIWTENDSGTYCSRSHRVMVTDDVYNFVDADNFKTGDPVLTWSNRMLEMSATQLSRLCTEKGDVMQIEMLDGHIYATGNDPDALIVAHNKRLDPP